MPRDPRSYITIVDTMPEHEKAEGLSDAAFRLLIETWCWCRRQNNDGEFTPRAWARRGTDDTRRELEVEGWVDVTPDGVAMHDYAEHQQTKDARSKLSAARAAAGSKGGLAKAARAREELAKTDPDQGERSNGVASATQQTKQALAEVEVEVEVEEKDTPLATLVPPSGGTPKTPRRTGTNLPDGWLPPVEDRAWALEEFPHLTQTDLRQMHEEFVDYWRGVPGARGRKLDWAGTWRNRIRDQAPRRRRRSSSSSDGIDWQEAERLAATMDEARQITNGAGTR